MAKKIVKNKSALHNQPVTKPVQEPPKPQVVQHIPNKRIVSKPATPAPVKVEQKPAQKAEPVKPVSNNMNLKGKRIVTKPPVQPVKKETPAVVISDEPTMKVPQPKVEDDLSVKIKVEEPQNPNFNITKTVRSIVDKYLAEVADVLVDQLVEKFITRDEIEMEIENTIKKMIIENATPPEEAKKPAKKAAPSKEPQKVVLPQGMVFQPISRKKK